MSQQKGTRKVKARATISLHVTNNMGSGRWLSSLGTSVVGGRVFITKHGLSMSDPYGLQSAEAVRPRCYTSATKNYFGNGRRLAGCLVFFFAAAATIFNMGCCGSFYFSI